MAELPPLNVRVVVNASGVSAGVAQATAGLEQISAKATTAQARMSSLGMSFRTLAKGLIATGGIIALSNAIRGMRDEAIQTEVETSRLSQVLDNLGTLTDKDKSSVVDYANSFQKLGFEGSEAINAMGTLVNASQDVGQSQRMMALAADYARDKHIGLNTASRMVVRGMQGAGRIFKEYNIVLDKSLPKNQAITKAFAELSDKLSGRAIKYTETFAGRMAVLRQRFEDFLENAIAPVLPYLTKFLGMLVGIAEWIQRNSAALKVYGGIVLVVTGYLKGMAVISAILAGINPFTWIVIGVAALGAAFVAAWNRFKIFRETMAEGLATVVQLIGYVVGGFASLARVLAKVPGLGFLKGVADSADEAAKSIGKVATSVDALKNKKISAPKMPAMPKLDSSGIVGNVPAGALAGAGGGGGDTVQYVTVYASNTNDIAKKLSKAAKNGTPIGGK